MSMVDRCALWIATALFLTRAVLGLIFLMAGVYKVFSLGPVGHVRRFFLPYSVLDRRAAPSLSRQGRPVLSEAV
jgi:uncharacterized membrane protein YphA (DoxX/SURF4 family)